MRYEINSKQQRANHPKPLRTGSESEAFRQSSEASQARIAKNDRTSELAAHSAH
jgi:hypothetical protein